MTSIYSNSARIAVMNNTWQFLLGKGTKLELRNLFNQAGIFTLHYTRSAGNGITTDDI